MARIELKGVSKRWGDVAAVEDLDLAVGDGEFMAILGPSGCGKSTTLLMLAGIYAPTSGRIMFDGQTVNEVEARDRNVGIVFQSYALYPHKTVGGNIMFPLRFNGTPPAEAEARAEEIARLVQVHDLLERRPGQLSGGQQQRVALARALVKEPQLLLLDEPLSNLDARLRLTMRSEIKGIQKKLGITTILVTHDQTEAMTMADRIACMREGRIEQVGSPDDLYLRPETLFVASFVGSPPINLLEGVAGEGGLNLGGRVLPAEGLAGGEVTLGIRPERLAIGREGFPGRIEEIEPMGREILYLLESPMGTLSVLEPAGSPERRLGESVRLTFAPEDTLLFDNRTQSLLKGAHVRPGS
ncbi:MAG: ABC transporter ATP-binding protein [bacterium]